MKADSLIATFAGRWSAIYTWGLPAAIRARRREEIAEDLWEQQHDLDDGGTHQLAGRLAARVVLGMPADVMWRASERRPVRRLDLTNFAVDRTWDRRMGAIARGAVIVAVAFLVPMAVGMPALLAVTLPASALIIRQRARSDKRGEAVIKTTMARQRRIRFIVFAVAALVWAVGLVINSLPSEETHDRYWILFITPMMVGFMVGVVVLPMLIWSMLPRQDVPSG